MRFYQKWYRAYCRFRLSAWLERAYAHIDTGNYAAATMCARNAKLWRARHNASLSKVLGIKLI